MAEILWYYEHLFNCIQLFKYVPVTQQKVSLIAPTLIPKIKPMSPDEAYKYYKLPILTPLVFLYSTYYYINSVSTSEE